MHPIFSTVCAGPDMSNSDRAHADPLYLLRVEESGTLWLWAWPELLGWPAPITWLFSLVTGNYPFPGDLWGVDSNGELLIVETKAASIVGGLDPFRDFIGYEERQKREEDLALKSCALRRRWESFLSKEEKFIGENLDKLKLGGSLGGRTLKAFPGIVPYSSKRVVVWSWRSLYLKEIARVIQNQSYRKAVSEKLAVREHANPDPHYLGVLTCCGEGNPHLSTKGQKGYECLRAKVPAARVHLFVIKAKPLDAWKVEISSQRRPLL